MPNPSIGLAHRLRAALLGSAAIGFVLVLAGVATARLLTEQQQLTRRATIEIFDAVPMMLWAALVLALLWAALVTAGAVLTILGTTAADSTGGGSADAGGPEHPLPGGSRLRPGPAAWVVGILLALTSLGTLDAATAEASPVPLTVATATPAGDGDAIPTPSFGPVAGATNDTTQAGNTAPATPFAGSPESCTGEVPAPSWLPPTPGRTSQLAEDSAGLITGCGAADESDSVVVHRGDTLWSIAAARLGPAADAAAVAAEWPRWYAANREVIGEDPGLLRIGQQLHAPTRVLEGSK